MNLGLREVSRRAAEGLIEGLALCPDKLGA
jgi:hypothetical protein